MWSPEELELYLNTGAAEKSGKTAAGLKVADWTADLAYHTWVWNA